MNPLPIRRAAGFTLIELMIVVGIAAVIMLLGAPNLALFMAEQRVRTAASDMMAEIALARAKAVETSRRVYFERTSAQWKDGWRIYVDNNSNGTYDAGTDEQIAINLGLEGRIQICSPTGDFATNLIFRPDGRVVRVGAAAATDGIYILDNMGDADVSNNRVRALLFGPSGRVTSIKMNSVATPCGIS
jgi:type IV fimbrial biogenesis protein FimT